MFEWERKILRELKNALYGVEIKKDRVDEWTWKAKIPL